MTSRLLCAFFFIFVLLIHPPTVLPEQIIVDSEKQFQLAFQALEESEYQRAVVEFERFIHFFPEDEKVPRARYLIGICYLRGKRYETARRSLEEVYRAYYPKPVSGKALFLIGESYFRQGFAEEAAGFFKKVIETYPQPELKNAAIYRLGWSRMQKDKWQEASKTFNLVEKSSRLYPSAIDLSDKALMGEDLPYKSPTTAGVLAVIPGLGHVYTDRYKDGMVALLLNGLTIWAAVEAFNQDLNVLGGVLVALELGWYSGNIYSAVNSAHKYNRKVRADFRRSLTDSLNLNLFTSREVPLGLALKIDF
jgi:TolA-binding protein